MITKKIINPKIFLGGSIVSLLASTLIPLVEVKGFDTFTLDTVSLVACQSVRITLGIALFFLLLRKINVVRWWLALSIGILAPPLADRLKQSIDMLEMMDKSGVLDSRTILDALVLLPGAWVCLAGLVAWAADAAVAGYVLLVKEERPSNTPS